MMESLITNWADAVRHYDSTLAPIARRSKVARQNRDDDAHLSEAAQELLNRKNKPPSSDATT